MCDDVMLICINLLTFTAVIYSYKTLFLFIFSAQICVLKHKNASAPGEGQSLLPRTLPLDAVGVSILGAFGASNFFPPSFKTVAPPLDIIDLYAHGNLNRAGQIVYRPVKERTKSMVLIIIFDLLQCR